MPVGRPAKKTAKIGRVLFEQIGPEGPVQTGSSFGSRGHPRSPWMVPFDRRQNFLCFYRATLCIRGTSHGPVSVCVCVCQKPVFY